MNACLLLLLFSFMGISSYRFSNFGQRITSRSLFYLHATDQVLGRVSLVGAGPGDPDLLTLQAVKRIQQASLVVADRLISKEILSLVSCELLVANKKPGCAEEAQEEIYDWVVAAASQGREVVRLKIGDPFLFGRGAEEVLEYRRANLSVEIVAGLSSSYTAPLAANIPLTHRGTATQVVIGTGYAQEGAPGHLDLPIYHPKRTLVLLMAIGRLSEIADSLCRDKCYPATMPVAIIEQATTPRQRVILGTLGSIGRIAIEQGAKPPATIVIGDVVDTL